MGLKSLLTRLLISEKVESNRNWKDNIVPHAVHAVHISLKNSDSIFETLRKQDGFVDLFPDKEYINKFKTTKLEINSINSSKIVFKGETWKLTIENDPIQGVYDRSIFYARMLRESIKRDGISFKTVSKHYPHEIINKFLIDFSSDLKFIALYSPKDFFWENLRQPNVYKFKGGLKITKDFILGEAVDLSDRPGRQTLIDKCSFQGAPEYWFGPSYSDSLYKENFLSFKNSESTKELQNDIVYIKICEQGKYWDDLSQNRIKRLRKHLKIDELDIKNQ